MSKEQKKTHFGYQTVNWDEKEKKVGEVFRSVAKNYDLMNDLMSFGIHRYWKTFTIGLSNVHAGHCVLDLAGGTGDLARAFSKRVGSAGQVILSDINASMLEVGRDKLLDKGVGANVHYAQANAECLPFEDNTFNCITIAFGLRNVTDKLAALQSMYRVCKPGGQVMVLEFSKPTLPGLKPFYDWYSFNILPKLGQWFADDASSYAYLAESIRMHPDQDSLKQMIEKAGFEDCRYYNMTGGIVALHIAHKY
jgi:demethylmenaquinone methyltransferase / 2-methoxy-6-polyprenyl-1,4-benzoquinol methylase